MTMEKWEELEKILIELNMKSITEKIQEQHEEN